MTPDKDDDTAAEKFEKFQAALKQVLTAPKPPPPTNDEKPAPRST